MAANGDDLLLRHSSGERSTHLIHLVSFLGLLFTGIFLYSASLNRLISSGVLLDLRYLHRVFAVLFIGGILWFLAAHPREASEEFRALWHWEKEDLSFFGAMVPWLLGLRVRLPEEGKYNGGQKLVFLLVFFGSIILVVTGFLMWIKGPVPVAWLRWSYPLHDLFAIGLATVVLVHAYLGLLFPATRHTRRAMFGDGKMLAAYAREHYHRWYEEVKGR